MYSLTFRITQPVVVSLDSDDAKSDNTELPSHNSRDDSMDVASKPQLDGVSLDDSSDPIRPIARIRPITRPENEIPVPPRPTNTSNKQSKHYKQ